MGEMGQKAMAKKMRLRVTAMLPQRSFRPNAVTSTEYGVIGSIE